jgi:hypothetical protein
MLANDFRQNLGNLLERGTTTLESNAAFHEFYNIFEGSQAFGESQSLFGIAIAFSNAWQETPDCKINIHLNRSLSRFLNRLV